MRGNPSVSWFTWSEVPERKTEPAGRAEPRQTGQASGRAFRAPERLGKLLFIGNSLRRYCT